jgi:hypothetical protein
LGRDRSEADRKNVAHVACCIAFAQVILIGLKLDKMACVIGEWPPARRLINSQQMGVRQCGSDSLLVATNVGRTYIPIVAAVGLRALPPASGVLILVFSSSQLFSFSPAPLSVGHA